LPNFIHIATRDALLTVFSTNPEDAKSYEIVVTGSLDNWFNVQGRDGFIDEADPLDPDRPDPNLIYQSSFTINLEVEEPPPEFVVLNTAPYFVPVPRKELPLIMGMAFKHKFGPAYDAEQNPVSVEIDLGDAASFVKFDGVGNQLTVEEGDTIAANLGEYPIKITLKDEPSTPNK